MRRERGDGVVHRSGFVLWLGVAITAVAAIAAIQFFADGEIGLGLTVAAVLIVPYLGVIRPHVLLTDEEVVLVGLMEERIRYDEIDDVRFADWSWTFGVGLLEIDRGHGWRVAVLPFHGMWWWRGRWQHRLRDEILERVDAARGDRWWESTG